MKTSVLAQKGEEEHWRNILKNHFSINTVSLGISSVDHQLSQVVGNRGRKTLGLQVDVINRLLLAALMANFDSADDGMAILADYYLSSVLPRLRGNRLCNGSVSITKSICAVPRLRESDGLLGLSAIELTVEHVLSLFRNRSPKPEIARA